MNDKLLISKQPPNKDTKLNALLSLCEELFMYLFSNISNPLNPCNSWVSKPFVNKALSYNLYYENLLRNTSKINGFGGLRFLKNAFYIFRNSVKGVTNIYEFFYITNLLPYPTTMPP